MRRRPAGWRARARGSFVVFVAVALVAAGGLWSAASAAPTVGAPTYTLPTWISRGAAPVGFTVTVPTRESATFRLQASSPDLSVVLPSSCQTDTGASCVIVSGSVTIGDAGPPTEEPTDATFVLQVSASSTIELSSTEGVAMMSKETSMSVSVTGVGLTTGAASTPGTTRVVANPSSAGDGEAIIDVASDTSPGQPAPNVNRGSGSSIVYTAMLSRSGRVAQTTTATVKLVPEVTQGTTIASSDTEAVTFASNEVSKVVSFRVNVPPTATPGTASYHIVVTYDPTGTDGTPTDTERGRSLPFNVVVPNPTVALALDHTAGDLTVDRGESFNLTVRARNTSAEGAAAASDVTIALPVSPKLTIGSPTATSGTPTVATFSNPQTVSVTFSSPIEPGATASLTVPVSVNADATKVTGAADIVVGPASGTFSPPASTAATSSNTLDFEINDVAVVGISATPSSQRVLLDPFRASFTVTYDVSTSGPDPASGLHVDIARPTNAVGGPDVIARDGAGDPDSSPDWICDPSTEPLGCSFVSSGGALAPGADAGEIAVTWTVNTSGTLDLPATVSAANSASPATTSPTVIVDQPDPLLGLEVDASPDPLTVASHLPGHVMVTYRATNSGPGNVAARLLVTTPSGATLQSLTGPHPCNLASASCDLGGADGRFGEGDDLVYSATFAIAATAVPPPSYSFAGTIDVTAPAGGTDVSASDSVATRAPEADLRIMQVTTTPETVIVPEGGGVGTFMAEVRVVNAGPDIARGFTLTFDGTFGNPTTSEPGVSCSGLVCASTSTLGVNASAVVPVSFTVFVPEGDVRPVTGAVTIENGSSDITDPCDAAAENGDDSTPDDGCDVANNSGLIQVNLGSARPNPTVALAITGDVPDGTSLARGAQTTFSVTATALGSSRANPASNVDVAIPVAPNLRIDSITTSSGSFTITPVNGWQIVGVVFPTIPVGTSATITIATTVLPNATAVSGPLNDVVVGPASGSFGPPAGSTVSDSSASRHELVREVDVAVAATVRSVVRRGPSTDITIGYGISNGGPDGASDVVVVAERPASASGSPALELGDGPDPDSFADWACDVTSTQVSCLFVGNGGSLQSQTSAGSLSITWIVGTKGTFSFDASVSAAELDRDSSNNATSTSVVVGSSPPKAR